MANRLFRMIKSYHLLQYKILIVRRTNEFAEKRLTYYKGGSEDLNECFLISLRCMNYIVSESMIAEIITFL